MCLASDPFAAVLLFFGSALLPGLLPFAMPLTVLIYGSDVSSLSNSILLALFVYNRDYLSKVRWYLIERQSLELHVKAWE